MGANQKSRDTGVRILSGSQVSELLDEKVAFEAVADAFARYAGSAGISPSYLNLDAPAGWLHVKAGGVLPFFGLKANTGFEANPSRHELPRIQGVIILYSAENGAPLAIMDQDRISLLRTGAATAVAATRLAREGARRLVIMGTGRQAPVQVNALRRVLQLERVDLLGRDESRAQALAAQLARKTGVDVRGGVDRRVLSEADIIITVTSSAQPVLGLEDVRAGAFVAAVGADRPEKHELTAELIAAATVVADMRSQVLAKGDTLHAVNAGVVQPSHVAAELGDVLTGRHPGRQREDEIIVFDTVGTALQDLACAAAVLTLATAAGIGVSVDLVSG